MVFTISNNDFIDVENTEICYNKKTKRKCHIKFAYRTVSFFAV